MQDHGIDRKTFGSLVRDLAGELMLALRQEGPSGDGDARGDLVARLGRGAICGFLAALVVYTGLMFLMWAGVAGTCAALMRAGLSVGSALCTAFLAMGLFWAIAGSVTTWVILRRLRDMPVHPEHDAVLLRDRQTSHTTPNI